MAIDVDTTVEVTGFVGPQFDEHGNLTVILTPEDVTAEDAIRFNAGIRVTLDSWLAETLAVKVVENMAKRLL